MDKSKFAALGERLVSGGAQMSRKVSGKMKELLQAQTPESKMVDEATSDTMSEPNWGINLRICALLNSEEFNGPEVMKAVKKKISGKNMTCQRFSLDLLEVCALNCEKVFSEIASEKVLEEMVNMIYNPQTNFHNRQRALQLIQAWGESPDLGYLPVFSQTYMNLKNRGVQFSAPETEIFEPIINSGSGQHHFEPPEGYPGVDQGNPEQIPLPYYSGLNFSAEEKKEALAAARNSIELLTSLTDHGTHPAATKDELVLSILEKCKQSQSIIQTIVESTVDDDALLFEALNVHEELQQVLLKFEIAEKTPQTDEKQPEEEKTPDVGGGAAAGSSLSDSSGLNSDIGDPHYDTDKDQKNPRVKD